MHLQGHIRGMPVGISGQCWRVHLQEHIWQKSVGIFRNILGNAYGHPQDHIGESLETYFPYTVFLAMIICLGFEHELSHTNFTLNKYNIFHLLQ